MRVCLPCANLATRSKCDLFAQRSANVMCLRTMPFPDCFSCARVGGTLESTLDPLSLSISLSLLPFRLGSFGSSTTRRQSSGDEGRAAFRA
jgi:hypothetical protein